MSAPSGEKNSRRATGSAELLKTFCTRAACNVSNNNNNNVHVLGRDTAQKIEPIIVARNNAPAIYGGQP